ncbi:N-acetylglucosamine-binding protein GbpA [Vibrio sp. 10N.247.311.14]|uniref:N-acetylglucosamine-binding protein GbpA n=2 Tax=Vibrio TaxID=662 RepID=UPI000C832FB5|nr:MULTISPECIES: N-acetylglucosamine-binding protein GbpA [unclassified Vibrio]PMK21672.1 N-acetylglucosamine-binding protein A [Vibrio sp. 10N.261.54.C3]PMN98013.1 N-acetylglucosamine-binding protein A [Vibrio sp. 10N.222.55.F9]PMO03129.1 N-acetylglucosamine-binding protein A [Vibrio sp. 10N.222.55.C12]PMO08639.1 N-acetylglucosamine-binding protein A [Vibrio sp. 10N.222.54.F10]PMO16001.1 N-acetylglucosamine-binding protein A [Vibrio sp. 10N.222.54.B6]
MKLEFKKSVIAVMLSTLSGGALAHGYVSLSEDGLIGRAALCGSSQSEGLTINTNCDGVEWEPQSVEGPDGFPEVGPADGKIANAGMARFLNLNEQTAQRWVKQPIQSGSQQFEWTYTAPHPAASWKYYITKQDWDVNSPLTRDSFDLIPFCEVQGNGELPAAGASTAHECSVPDRDGYQVILAVWDVSDTPASFYNVMDVEFEDNGPQLPDWERAGQIIPTMDLNVGDAVYTRVFETNGENPALSTRIEITSEQNGKKSNWAHELAKKVNQEQDGSKRYIKAGALVEGELVPAYGANPVYVNKDQGLVSVEIGYDIDVPESEIKTEVSGLDNEYLIDDTPTVLDLALASQGDAQVEITAYNHNRDTLAHWEDAVKDGESVNPQLELSKSEPGHHMLVVKTRNSEGKLVGQETLDFNLVEPAGDVNYVYPDGFGRYVAGDVVKFENEGVYECFGAWAAHCNTDGFQPGVAADPAWVAQQWKKLD